jgi:hypothetical protein
MNRTRVISLIVVGVVVLPFIWLLYENSSGKEVWGAIQTFAAVVAGYYLARGVWPGVAAVVAPAVTLVVAVIGSLVFTSGVEKHYSTGTAFLLETSTGRPAFIRLMPFQAEVEELINVVPSDAWKADNASGIYHHLLQRAILQYLIRQQSRRAGRMTTSVCGWDPEIWQERGASTTIIGAEEINRTFAGNRFISAQFFPAAELVVPKGTWLLGIVPGTQPGRTEGLIELKNRYFDLTIQTQFTASMRGIQGNYARLTTQGADRQDERFSIAHFTIAVSGQTLLPNRLFPYHPNTATYLDWTEQIAKHLTCIFGEKDRWKYMVDELNFRHLTGANK